MAAAAVVVVVGVVEVEFRVAAFLVTAFLVPVANSLALVASATVHFLLRLFLLANSAAPVPGNNITFRTLYKSSSRAFTRAAVQPPCCGCAADNLQGLRCCCHYFELHEAVPLKL